MAKVGAVVVTYNRKALLQECLEAIVAQTVQPSRIILIDNNSTDGTEEMLRATGLMEKLRYVKLETNTGGAGGFCAGIAEAQSFNLDWVWIMDDDTIPMPDCLEKLLLADEKVSACRAKIPGGTERRYVSPRQKRPVSFLASAVYGEEGEFMNVPVISDRVADNGYTYWPELLGCGLANIKCATFVSLLISCDAVRRCGLPCKDFFIWGDDTEYTTRLTEFYGDAFLVGDSVAIHKRKNARPLDLRTETDLNRIRMLFYLERNTEIRLRYYEHLPVAKRYIANLLKACLLLPGPMGAEKCRTKWRGCTAALTEYPRFKANIDAQLGLDGAGKHR